MNSAPPNRDPLKIENFTGGITATNGYLAHAPGGILAIDAPDGFAEWIAARGVKVDALLLTHMHFDHVMDAAAILESHGCQVYAHSEISADLTLEGFLGGLMGTSFAVERFPLDRVIAGEPSLEAGGLEWELLYVPGHSADSLCFYSAECATAFTGDTLMAGGIGRSDFPGGSSALLTSGIRSKLLSLPPETVIYPGHGPDSTIGQEADTNPFL
jgi:glyoxylase-like metal-dependent hydrolase (beta-lactamase superfamily II)